MSVEEEEKMTVMFRDLEWAIDAKDWGRAADIANEMRALCHYLRMNGKGK